MITISNDNTIKFTTKAENSSKGVGQAFRELSEALVKRAAQIAARGSIVAKLYKQALSTDIIKIETETTIKFINNVLEKCDTSDIISLRSQLRDRFSQEALTELYENRVEHYKDMSLMLKTPVSNSSGSYLAMGLVSTKRQMIYQRVIGDYILDFFIMIDIGIRGKDKIADMISPVNDSVTSDEYLSLAMRNYGARPTKITDIPVSIRKKTTDIKDKTINIGSGETRIVKINLSEEHLNDKELGTTIESIPNR